MREKCKIATLVCSLVLGHALLWLSGYIAGRPSAEERVEIGARYVNQLLSVGFKMFDETGSEVSNFDEE